MLTQELHVEEVMTGVEPHHQRDAHELVDEDDDPADHHRHRRGTQRKATGVRSEADGAEEAESA